MEDGVGRWWWRGRVLIRDRSRGCKTGTEPERNHVPVPGPLIQQVPAARNHSSDHAQPRISWYFYLHVADMAGNLPTSGYLTLGLVPFREFPVPSRSVYSALTTRPDPYRGLKSGPGTISNL